MLSPAKVCLLQLLLLGALCVSRASPPTVSALRRLRRSYFVEVVVNGTNECNVNDYGAKGDGKTDDTSAIQHAIDDCGSKGGGTVTFGSGDGSSTYLMFAIQIKHSNMHLNIQSGVTLLISNDRDQWPGQSDIITAASVNNIAITGKGTIDGQGAVWWAHRDDFRPRTVYFHDVQNALIADVTFRDPPNHCLELYADHCEVAYVNVLAPPSTGVAEESHNTDAVDVHGTPFYVHDCYFDTGDDNIAAHANDTLVENMRLGSGHGLSIGSLCNDYLRNITFRNSTFKKTTNGARIKVKPGCVGHVWDVTYQDLTMEDVETPIDINVHYDEAASSSAAGSSGHFLIENVQFLNIKSKGSKYSGDLICSSDYVCKDISMEKVDLGSDEWTCDGGKGCDCFTDVFGTTKDVSPSACIKG